MPRSVNSSLVAELQKDGFTLVHLVDLGLGSGLALTDCAHNVTYGPQTYVAVDQLLEIGSPTETQDLRVNTVNIGFSGVDQTYISIVLGSDWVNRSATISRAAVSDGQVIGAPLTVFNGQITKWQIVENRGRSGVRLSVASHWADFEKLGGRLTNNSSQQFYFPNDLGFEYAANTIRDIKWGRE